VLEGEPGIDVVVDTAVRGVFDEHAAVAATAAAPAMKVRRGTARGSFTGA
jgi:hypothetical protein